MLFVWSVRTFLFFFFFNETLRTLFRFYPFSHFLVKYFMYLKIIYLSHLEQSVTIFKSTRLDNLYNMYQFGYNRTSVKSVFFKNSSTLDWMTEMFTGWKLSNYYLKYDLSQKDAELLSDLNIKSVEDIINKNWDNYKDREMYPFLKNIVKQLDSFEEAIKVPFILSLSSINIPASAILSTTVGDLERTFDFRLNGVLYTTSLKDLQQSNRDILENVFFPKLRATTLNDMKNLAIDVKPLQIYLLSFKSLILGYLKHYNATQLHGIVITVVNHFRNNPVTLLLASYGVNKHFFLSNSIMFPYRYLFQLTDSQYMYFTNYTEDDIKLFSKTTYNDHKIITKYSPMNGNFVTLENTLVKQGGTADVLVSRLKNYAMIHDNNTIQNLSYMQILSNSTDIESVYGLIAKEALIQKVLDILIEKRQEQTFRNIVYNMSLGNLADVVFNTTKDDMMRGTILSHFTRIKQCKYIDI